MDPHPRPHAASQREMHPPGGLTWHRTTPKAHSASGSPITAEQAAPEPPKAASSSPFVPSDHREAAPFTAVGYFSLERITHVETTASFSLISTALQISECSVFSYSRFKSYQKMERTLHQRGTTARKAAAEALELKGRGRTSARISSLMGEDSSTNSSGAQLPTRRDPQQLYKVTLGATDPSWQLKGSSVLMELWCHSAAEPQFGGTAIWGHRTAATPRSLPAGLGFHSQRFISSHPKISHTTTSSCRTNTAAPQPRGSDAVLT